MKHKLVAATLCAGVAIALAGNSATAVTKKATPKKPAAKATTTTAKPAAATPAPTAAPAAPAKASGKKGGTLVDVRNFQNGDPNFIDPGLASTVQGSQVTTQIYDGLMDIDYETSELKPAVAESFKWNATSDQVVFKLKKGTKFSNGEEVLPSSFKCSWERTVDPAFASPLSYHFDSIKGKSEVDNGKTKVLSGVVANDTDLTLTVTLTAPYADFVPEMQHTVFSPMTKDGCKAGRTYQDGIMVGNGPFKMEEPWKRGQFIKIVRYDGYYGGVNDHLAYLDGVEFKIVKDELAALNVFESGGADVSGIPGGKFNELTKKYGDRAAKSPQLVIQYMGFNWEDKLVGGFANAKLRQAISLAVNRKQINDAIFDGSRKEATGFTPIGIPGVKADAYGLSESANVAKAKQLLEEWGKPIPKIDFKYANSPTNVQISSIIRNNLKDIGVEVEFDAMLPTTYFDKIRENPGQMFRAGWAADFVGYDNFTYPLFTAKAVGGDNLTRFQSAVVDQGIYSARKTADAAKRNAQYQQAEAGFMAQAIVVPLYWNKWANILSPKVDKWVQGPTSFIDYSEVTMK